VILLQWIAGAFLLFILAPFCLGAIWFGISNDWISTFSIVGGTAGLALIFWLLNKFDWK
jgi:hypothetical protein